MLKKNTQIPGRIWHGFYFDGKSAAKKPAQIEICANTIIITVTGHAPLTWQLNDVVQTQGAFHNEPIRLERGVEAIVIDDRRFIPAIMSVAPGFASRFSDGGIQRNPALLWGTIALASVAFLIFSYFWGIPAMSGFLADRMPLSWEEKFGNAVIKEMTEGTPECENAEAIKAVNSVTASLKTAMENTPYTLKIHVVRNPMINAFAAPGGHIIVYTGLLEATNSPEELAAVMAHEIQHVVNKHSTKFLIRGLSSYAILSLVFGDVGFVADAASMLTNLSYSRELETEADDRAIELLSKANIDPLAMKSFFETMRKKFGRTDSSMPYLSSHPMTEDRIKNVLSKARALKQQEYIPLLPETDWKTVRTLCPTRSSD